MTNIFRCTKRIAVTLTLALVMGLPLAAVAQPVHPETARGTNPATQPATFRTTPAQPAQEYQTLQERPDRIVAVLPNRMIVIAQEIRTAPVVSAQVWVKTGSVYEQEHVGAGLSHFLEHLLSGGSTSTHTEEENNATLGNIGAQINASTSLDNVRYYINTTREHTDTAVELLSDWMQNALITQAEYARERDVIQREFDMGNGEPGRIFWKITQQVRYRQHPARHPTIGYLDEYLKITRDEIYAFYKRMYVPNNMVFVVAGDIDKHRVVDHIAQLWAEVEPRDLPKLSFPIEPEIDSPREATGTADMDKPRLRLAWPGTRVAAPGDYALDVLAVILGQGESSRLVRNVRDQSRVVNGIDAYNLSYTWGEGFFGIDAEISQHAFDTYGSPAENQAQQKLTTEARWDAAARGVKDTIDQVVERVVKEGITPEELARAKRQILARTVYEGQSVQAIANQLASDVIGTGDPDYFQHYSDSIQKITAEEVQAAARKFLDPNRLITIRLMPQPRGQKLPPMTRPADEGKPDGMTEAVNLDNSQLIARIRKATAEKRSSNEAITLGPIHRYVLPNGLRLLVQKSTVVPAVAVQMYQLGGLLADEPGKEGIASATMTMLMKGTKTRTAQQIAMEIEDLGAALDTQCGNNTSITRGLALKEDLPRLLDLFADVTLNPSFPDDEWAKLRPRIVAAIARQNDTWSGELRTKFREAYFGSHPWSQLPLGRAEVVDKLTTGQLADFYQRHLGAADTVISVFGDVEPEAVKKEIEKRFADLPAHPLEKSHIDPAPTPQAKILQFSTNKPLAAVIIGYGPAGTRKDPDYPKIQVLSRVLSSFPTGWLDEELRGRGPGLVYAVGAGYATGLIPGYFALLFNTQPASVPEAVKRSVSVIQRAREILVDDVTLRRAKAAVLTDEFMAKQTNGDRAMDASLNELYELGQDEPAHFQRAINLLTADDLREVARVCLKNPVLVVLSHESIPEEKLKAAMESPATQPAQ
ncbi:MAG: insulinase family protein [Phycisphaeraceae bacterium]|nr:insulinase family protein [Phycisphaeraceae bacterium]